MCAVMAPAGGSGARCRPHAAPFSERSSACVVRPIRALTRSPSRTASPVAASVKPTPASGFHVLASRTVTTITTRSRSVTAGSSGRVRRESRTTMPRQVGRRRKAGGLRDLPDVVLLGRRQRLERQLHALVVAEAAVEGAVVQHRGRQRRVVLEHADAPSEQPLLRERVAGPRDQHVVQVDGRARQPPRLPLDLRRAHRAALRVGRHGVQPQPERARPGLQVGDQARGRERADRDLLVVGDGRRVEQVAEAPR